MKLINIELKTLTESYIVSFNCETSVSSAFVPARKRQSAERRSQRLRIVSRTERPGIVGEILLIRKERVILGSIPEESEGVDNVLLWIQNTVEPEDSETVPS